MVEKILSTTQINHVSLRYFNVVGSGYEEIYDKSPFNLFPKIIKNIQNDETPKIFGRDYPTPDGTAIRDFVDVQAIAEAHKTVAEKMLEGAELSTVYNLGSQRGTSVLEIVRAFQSVTGKDFVPEILSRRPGDPPKIVASGELAHGDLQWPLTHNLEAMVQSAWHNSQI
jgi:UDP-glucose 4-epimerase